MAKKDAFIKKIFELSADPAGGALDFERFEASFELSTGRKFQWNTDEAKILARVFGNSPVLSQKTISNPIWADEICKSPYIGKRKPICVIFDELAFATKNMPLSDTPYLEKCLRLYKYREMTRLVARDLAGNIEAREMLEEWSDVARAMIETAYSYVFEQLSRKLGKPLFKSNGDTNCPCTGVIIALGKLGGHELNLSSDIDIIVLYSSDNGFAVSDAGRRTSNHEFFVKLTVELSRVLSRVTADGFAFRVDHELRPEGAQGTLANSLDAAERYYEYFGRDWERQALVRAAPIAGDVELGKRFIDYIRPFVYRRSVTLKDLTHMREMKARMEKDASSRHDLFDIKLGAGGIREVEFFAQALLQFYGGIHAKVRCVNTFDAIDRLAEEGLIHPFVAGQLSNAYSFLRRLENMIQVENDLQTHRLPKSGSELAALAKRAGFSKIGEFMETFQAHTGNVKRLFDALFEADYELQELEEAIRGNLETCTNDEERADSLAWFKQQEARRIQHLHLNGRIRIQSALRRLSLIADVVIKCAFELTMKGLVGRFGLPRNENGSPAGFAIIGMGKLGSKEMDYGSDVDLCFLYSGAGKTDGDRPISNVEFFTKLAQRIISILSISTRYGRAYIVDSELRPSGRQGTLVATLESFNEYHTNSAQVWERLSILRARVIAGNVFFTEEVKNAISALAYKTRIPPPETIRLEIEKIRQKSIRERIKDRPNIINLKIGDGSLTDLESIIQYYHVLHARECGALFTQNTFEIVDALGNEGLIDGEMRSDLNELLLFYRTLISFLRLTTGRQSEALDMNADYLDHIGQLMSYESSEDLIEGLKAIREKVKTLYNKVIGEV